jgi:hypothetical protein
MNLIFFILISEVADISYIPFFIDYALDRWIFDL